MKKIVIIATLILACVFSVGCQKKYVPDPAVEEYLNSGLTAQKAFDKLSSCEYTSSEIFLGEDDEEKGRQVSRTTFSIEDKQNLTLVMEQTFQGTYVSEGVTEQTLTLSKRDGQYIYCTQTNVPSKNQERQVDDKFALDLISSLVFIDNGAYDGGGLYYGDTFMLNIYKYPPESFYVDEESDLCVFDEKMHIKHESIGDVRLYQTTKINRLGLLEYDYEKYVSDDSTRTVISFVEATYHYI
ncbi:MAG: hypothetical protein K2L12_02335 [Clostridia bacterium]|nr:hypothetical protein [Clostridia bacterium]